MNKKSRYGLIVLGFLTFIILAPAIVLYVRGIKYDTEKQEFVQTGILAVRADPSSVTVSLDGEFVSDSAKDLKFLQPKDYSIKLEKENYQPWEKRLGVVGGQVTWASPSTGKIILFFSSPTTTTVSDGVTDFSGPGNKNILAFISQNSFIVTSPNNPNSSVSIVLPKIVTSILASPDSDFFLLQNQSTTSPVTLFVDVSARKAYDLGALFSTKAQWFFSGDDKLYAVHTGSLYSINTKIPSKTLLQSGIMAASFLGNDLYVLRSANSGLDLEVTSNPTETGQKILTNLPAFKQTEILISRQKQIFLLADGSLYRVGASLKQLASSVDARQFNSNDSSLIFETTGELDYINPYDGSVDFITRSSMELKNPLLRFDLANAFFVENNIVKALELDTRDHQNQFDLYQGTNIKKIALSDDGRNLIVLDGATLKILTIR